MHRTFVIVRTCLAFALLGCSDSASHRDAKDAGNPTSARRDAGADASTGADAGAVRDAAAMTDGDAASPPASCGNSQNLCPEICPKRLVLAGGTRNLAHCDGDCQFNLAFEFTPVPEDSRCSVAHADLIVHDSAGHRREIEARLIQGAWDRLGAISRVLEDATIDPPPNCASCTAKASVRFHPGDAMSGIVSREYQYPLGMPPEALKAADAFVQAMIDQLVSCRGPSIADCSVR
jgi:hypothetical protein